MERGLEITLEKQSKSEDLSPMMREQAARHLEETQAHAMIVKACLEKLGADPSAVKTGVARVSEMVAGFGTMFARDERVKDSLMAYASEHSEIACYKALRAAAMAAGEMEIAKVCERIIPDEERMARWLDANLPDVVVSYLQDAEAGTVAAH